MRPRGQGHPRGIHLWYVRRHLIMTPHSNIDKMKLKFEIFVHTQSLVIWCFFSLIAHHLNSVNLF